MGRGRTRIIVSDYCYTIRCTAVPDYLYSAVIVKVGALTEAGHTADKDVQDVQHGHRVVVGSRLRRHALLHRHSGHRQRSLRTRRSELFRGKAPAGAGCNAELYSTDFRRHGG